MSMIGDQLEFSNKVRELCARYYTPVKTLSDGKPNTSEDHPAMRAEAMSGTNCMVSLARIFKCIETFDPTLVLPVIIDLSFGLTENAFWEQHAKVLVPVYKTALHAAISAKLLEIDKHKTPEKEALRLRQSKEWHNLFIVAYDCLYGVVKTMNISTAFLQEIELTV